MPPGRDETAAAGPPELAAGASSGACANAGPPWPGACDRTSLCTAGWLACAFSFECDPPICMCSSVGRCVASPVRDEPMSEQTTTTNDSRIARDTGAAVTSFIQRTTTDEDEDEGEGREEGREGRRGNTFSSKPDEAATGRRKRRANLQHSISSCCEFVLSRRRCRSRSSSVLLPCEFCSRAAWMNWAAIDDEERNGQPKKQQIANSERTQRSSAKEAGREGKTETQQCTPTARHKLNHRRPNRARNRKRRRPEKADFWNHRLRVK